MPDFGEKLYKKFDSTDERLEAWQTNRLLYSEWRLTGDGINFVNTRKSRQLGLCFICLTPLGNKDIHVDHIFPLYLGGTNAKANLCVTHADCNMRKGAKVTMTYKQACRRRKLFNDLRKGKSLKLRIEKNPNTKISKKGLKQIASLEKYLGK